MTSLDFFCHLRLLDLLLMTLASLTAGCLIQFSSEMTTVAFKGQEVSFNCTVDCRRVDHVQWILNGKDSLALTDTELKPRIEYLLWDHTASECVNRLTFTATLNLNHTVVCAPTSIDGQCHLFNQSRLVTVIVQDFLKAPLDLTVDCHNNSVSLSWTPPQSFAPISSFSIRTSIAPTNETIISGKRRNFSIDLSDYGISRCEDKKITFMVGGINDLGNGKYSSYTLNSIKIDGQENCNLSCRIGLGVGTTVAAFIIFAVVTVTVMVGITICFKRWRKRAKQTGLLFRELHIKF